MQYKFDIFENRVSRNYTQFEYWRYFQKWFKNISLIETQLMIKNHFIATRSLATKWSYYLKSMICPDRKLLISIGHLETVYAILPSLCIFCFYLFFIKENGVISCIINSYYDKGGWLCCNHPWCYPPLTY